MFKLFYHVICQNFYFYRPHYQNPVGTLWLSRYVDYLRRTKYFHVPIRGFSGCCTAFSPHESKLTHYRMRFHDKEFASTRYIGKSVNLACFLICHSLTYGILVCLGKFTNLNFRLLDRIWQEEPFKFSLGGGALRQKCWRVCASGKGTFFDVSPSLYKGFLKLEFHSL